MRKQNLFFLVLIVISVLGIAKSQSERDDTDDLALTGDGVSMDVTEGTSLVIFDEICTLLGTCYLNTERGRKQCLKTCHEGECYECKGMTSISYCCLNF